MALDQREKRKRNYVVMRSIMDFGMGLIIFGFGVFLIMAPRIGFDFNIEPFFRYFFAGMCIVYGGWRIYRGFKKNYIQQNDIFGDD